MIWVEHTANVLDYFRQPSDGLKWHFIPGHENHFFFFLEGNYLCIKSSTKIMGKPLHFYFVLCTVCMSSNNNSQHKLLPSWKMIVIECHSRTTSYGCRVDKAVWTVVAVDLKIKKVGMPQAKQFFTFSLIIFTITLKSMFWLGWNFVTWCNLVLMRGEILWWQVNFVTVGKPSFINLEILECKCTDLFSCVWIWIFVWKSLHACAPFSIALGIKTFLIKPTL